MRYDYSLSVVHATESTSLNLLQQKCSDIFRLIVEAAECKRLWFHAAAELGHGPCSAHAGPVSRDRAAGNANFSEAGLWLECAIAQGISDAELDLTELTSRVQQL
jgi:hypothetical protein